MQTLFLSVRGQDIDESGYSLGLVIFETMQTLLKKLNFKGEARVHLLFVPAELQALTDFVAQQSALVTDLHADEGPVHFAMLFVTQLAELENAVHALAPRLEADAVLWICYPKGSSKRYRCDFNRDTGWQVCGTYNLEPVRQVAVNEDWSALRFRKTQFIKQLTRSSEMALGAEAKARLTQQKKT